MPAPPTTTASSPAPAPARWRTRTAPAENAAVAQLKFAFISRQDWSVNHWAGFDELLTQDLDFIVHLGDYIYETVKAGFQTGAVESAHAPLSLPDGTKRADGAIYATTLADYRSLYRNYRSDPRLQALHARFPMIAIWDDHEFSDDCWQDRQVYAATDDATANTAPARRQPGLVRIHAGRRQLQPRQPGVRQHPDLSLVPLRHPGHPADDRPAPVPRGPYHSGKQVGSEIGSRYFVPKRILSQVEAAKISAASGQLTPVSMLGDTQRDWWKTSCAPAQRPGTCGAMKSPCCACNSTAPRPWPACWRRDWPPPTTR